MERKTVYVTIFTESQEELNIVIGSIGRHFTHSKRIEVKKATFDFEKVYSEFQIETDYPFEMIRELTAHHVWNDYRTVLSGNNVISMR